MNCIKFSTKKITFESFLSGAPARDYIFQNTPYEVADSDGKRADK